MKKAFLLLLISFTLALTKCSEDRNLTEEKILAVECNNGRNIISRYGLCNKGESIGYFTLLNNQLKKDNKKNNSEVSSYFDSKYYDGKIFFSYIYDFGKIMIGYIDANDYSVNNTYVTSETSSQLYIEHVNDNYCIFYKTVHNEYVEYFVYDYISNKIIDSKSNSNGIDKSVLDPYKKDITSYISRTSYTYNNEVYKIDELNGKATIKKDDFNITIDYEYVLNRSDSLKEIDNIVGDSINSLGIEFFAIKETLYIVFYSESTLFGRGYLIPVIFSYDIIADTFIYVGATRYEHILYIE